MKVVLLMVVVLAPAALVECASALSCMHSTFEEQIARAKLIFVGTVERDTCEWAPCSPGGTDTCTIVTKYRFGRVTYLKSDGPPDSLIVMQVGGIIGNVGIHSGGSVSLSSGSRYVVLAVPHHTYPGYYAVSPCWMGPFGIWPDSGRADAVVHLGSSPLIAFDGKHMVGLHSQTWTPDLGIWEADETGRRAPLRRSLPELIRASDADLRSKLERQGMSQEQITQTLARVRTVSLFPHQDPGVRVSEEEFLKALASVIQRVEEAPAKK